MILSGPSTLICPGAKATSISRVLVRQSRMVHQSAAGVLAVMRPRAVQWHSGEKDGDEEDDAAAYGRKRKGMEGGGMCGNKVRAPHKSREVLK